MGYSTNQKNCVVTWVVSDIRKDKRSGALSPITRSKYAQLLFNKGAGFDERKTD
ncbi:hypothetical protein [Oceanobacillus manasiensis]|uniref:hypothetical protein n=1 Tax=Oceanobacillus manasiensis TaxID=586413 RepID=UPI000A8850B0|nr:hypothetical protein [Oceanobacillus manasiensis]